MGVIVAFDPAAFIVLFPQFNYLPVPQLEAYFTVATTFVRNDGCGPVTSEQMQTQLLNFATAHIVKLFAVQADGQAPSDIVGRINSASQGSVSVGSEMLLPPGSAQWWNQTQFGATFWLLSAPFRTMRYLPGPQKPVAPWPVSGTFFIPSGPTFGPYGNSWGWVI